MPKHGVWRLAGSQDVAYEDGLMRLAGNSKNRRVGEMPQRGPWESTESWGGWICMQSDGGV